MADILKYDESWNGHTGQEVQTFIANKLQSTENSINSLNDNAITNITFTQDENIKSQINYSYVKGNVEQTGSFSTTVQSIYDAQLELISYPEALPINTDLVIQYRYTVQNTTTSRAGSFPGKLKYTINGVTYSDITVPYKSTKLYTLTIPASQLNSGLNSINIEMYSQPTTDSMTNIAAVGISTYVLQLSLEANVEGVNNFAVNDSDIFSINLNVSNEGNIIQNIAGSQISYNVLVDNTNVSSGTFNSTYEASLSNVSLNSIRQLNSLTYGNTVGFYVFAYATVNSTLLYSNYIYPINQE